MFIGYLDTFFYESYSKNQYIFLNGIIQKISEYILHSKSRQFILKHLFFFSFIYYSKCCSISPRFSPTGLRHTCPSFQECHLLLTDCSELNHFPEIAIGLRELSYSGLRSLPRGSPHPMTGLFGRQVQSPALPEVIT